MRTLVDATGKELPQIEAPDPDKLRIYGDLFFLLLRSPRHATVGLSSVRLSFEPPLELGQFQLFRFDDVPRGIFTWARLSRDAERRMVGGEPLRPEDWNSGDAFWIMDLIAPYRGLAKSIVRGIMGPHGIPTDRFWFRRMENSDRRPERIVRIDKTARRKAKVMTAESFLARRSDEV